MNKSRKRLVAFKKNTIGWLLFLPAFICFYLAVWRPQVVGVIWSFFKMNGYSVSKFVGLKNYITVIKNTNFWTWVLNTFKYVFWSLIFGYLPPLIFALILNELVHMRSTFRAFLYLPVVIPGIAGMLIWKFAYSPEATGLFNMLLGYFGVKPFGWLQDSRFTIMLIQIYSSWKGFGATMLLYYAALQGVDTNLYEAAALDGAKPLKKLFHVTLPQIEGTMVLCLVSQIIAVFQTMEQPLAMTGGGPNGASTSLGYKMYEYGFVSQGTVGQSLAIGGIMFIILVWLNVFYYKANKKIESNM